MDRPPKLTGTAQDTSATEGLDARAADVLRSWFGEGSARGERRKAWFEKDPAFDARIRDSFLPLVELAAAGGLAAWNSDAESTLALIVVLDQFPRNLFRGSGRAFASDASALTAANHCLDARYDRTLRPVERMFCYLPFEHSESLADQRRSCELMQELEPFPETADVYRYALRHREIIERFGRFPHRNAALRRTSTAEEDAFLLTPGSGF